MKKTLLTILFPVILIIACSIGVWANEQSAAQPGCGKCAKSQQAEVRPCCNKGDEGDKSVKIQQPDNNKPCCDKGSDKFVKMQAAEGKPCGTKGCDKCAKMQQTAPAAPAEQKPCCNTGKQQ